MRSASSRAARQRPVSSPGRRRPDPRLAAVGERDQEPPDAVRRAPVDDGAHARRVVADHAADRGPRRGRRVGAEAEAVRAGRPVEVGLHDAGLDAREPALRVDLEDAVAAGGVDHEARPDRLAGEARARAAERQRQRVLARVGERRAQVVDRARDEHGLRLDAVDGAVRRVREPRRGVLAHLSCDPTGELRERHRGSLGGLAATPAP